VIDIPAGVAYIASPYSHPDAAVRAGRYEAALDFQVWCLASGIRVFSPIVHSHQAALRGGLPTDAAFWRSFNLAMFTACDRMFFLKAEGWQRSEGMRLELEDALVRPGFPTILFEPDEGTGFRAVLTLTGDPGSRADLQLYGADIQGGSHG
jgi:hypothetical protein